MPVTKQTVLDAVEFFFDNWDLPPTVRTPLGRFVDGWIAGGHFAVKFTDVPKILVSTWAKKNREAFAEWLAAWKTGEHRIPVSPKRGDWGVFRDRNGHETCIQPMYANLLRGLKVVRYDGPGFKGAPLIGLFNGEPVVVVMPYLLPGAGGNVQ